MIYLNKIYTKILAALLLMAVVSVIGCQKDDTPAASVPTESIEALIKKDADLTLFNYAINKVKLNSFTEGPGPFTIFAPTNQAFTNLGIGSTAAIDAMDTTSLSLILGYHIQSLLRTYTEIPLGPNAAMTSQTGVTQYASRNTSGAFVNGIQVLDQGTLASNGIYYKTAAILLPPSTNVMGMLRLISDYKLMAQAIKKTNDTATYISSTITLFALSNSVMTANGYDSTTIANLSGTGLTTLGNLIKYQTITGQRVFAPDFRNQQYVTRFSATNKITVTTGSTLNVKGTSNASPFQVTGGNWLATNGVIHALNGMLKP